MIQQAVERHTHHNGTGEKQRYNIREKFTKKSFIPQARPRPSIECTEIEHSVDKLQNYVSSKQKNRTIASHTHCMLSFCGGAIQCIGLRNGSLTIGDWLNEDRHRSYKVSPTDPNSFDDPNLCVSSLLYFDNFLVAGLHDGAILIFSVLQSRVVQREYYHRSPIVFLGNSQNTHLVSVCQDGNMVIYSLNHREGKKIFPIIHESHANTQIRSGYIYEDSLILGTENGFLEMLNIPGLKKSCSPIHVCDSGCVVTALWKNSHTIVTGTSNGNIQIYEIARQSNKMRFLLSKILHYHKAAIVRLYCDFGMNFWSADVNGTIISWDKSPVTNHEILSYQKIEEPIRDISFNELTRSTALWTTSANGQNNLYWTTVNPAQKEVEEAIKDIESEIKSKEGDLHHGFSSVDDVEKIEEHVYRRLPELSAFLRRRRTLAYYFYRWRRYIHVKVQLARMNTSMNILVRRKQEKLKFKAWNALLEHVYLCKRNLTETKIRSFQEIIEFRSVATEYYDAWYRWHEEINRRNNWLEKCLEALFSKYLKCGLLPFYRSLYLYAKLIHSVRSEMLSVCLCLTETTKQRFGRRFFLLLSMNKTQTQKNQKLQMLSRTLLGKTTSELLSSCMEKIKAFHDYFCRNSRMSLMAKWLTLQRERIMRRRLYGRFSINRIQRTRQNIDGNRASLLKTLDDLQNQARILNEKKSSVLLHESLLEELHERERMCLDQQRTVDSLRASSAQIDQEIETAKAPPKAQVTEHLVEIMAVLKCKTLNFDADYVLIQRTVDRANSFGAIRIFMNAHLDIKRSVINVLGVQPKKKSSDDRMVDLTYTWGTAKESILMALKKFPSHTHSALVDAIKRMVVAFDMLSQKEVSIIDIDEEIVANATGLVTMYEFLAEQRSKKTISRFR